MTTSFKISDDLYLVCHKVAQGPYQQPAGVDYIVVIDCSGSMSYDLPKIREQLKAKLVDMVGFNDTVSIVWFSGRGEYGILLKTASVATLRDLGKVNAAIDRWLKPVGLTGFAGPLEEVAKLAAEIKTPDRVISLFFMSDGHDNQSTRSNILTASSAVAPYLNGATVVEYGYYADRDLLGQMATLFGGEFVFNEGFADYSVTFKESMINTPVGQLNSATLLPGDYIDNLVFTYIDADRRILTYELQQELLGPTAYVPNFVTGLWALSKTRVGRICPFNEDALYAALAVFAPRRRADLILPILRNLADVRLIKLFGNCFTKQQYSDFQATVKDALFIHTERFVDGCDENAMPDDDAFTILDLIGLLGDHDRLMLDHEAFQYNRISRGTVSKSKAVDIAEVQRSLAGKCDKDTLLQAAAQLQAAVEQIVDDLEFVPDAPTDGYSVDGIVYHSSRANISLRVRKTGKVKLPSNTFGIDEIDTFVWRNYAIIKDGLVNVDVLPVKLSRRHVDLLMDECAAGRIDASVFPRDGEIHLVQLSKLPVINQKMVAQSSAANLIGAEYVLLQGKARQKVLNSYNVEWADEVKTAGLAERYGVEAAEWLKSLGITDNGFNPPTEQAESTDTYPARELGVKLKGLSSLPAVDKVRTKMQEGKSLTPSEALLAPTISSIESMLNGPLAKVENVRSTMQKTIEQMGTLNRVQVRGSNALLAKEKFVIIVGQGWFSDLQPGEDTLTVEVDGVEVTGKIDTRIVDVKI